MTAELARVRAVNAELVAVLEGIKPMFDNDSPLLSAYAHEIELARAALAKVAS